MTVVGLKPVVLQKSFLPLGRTKMAITIEAVSLLSRMPPKTLFGFLEGQTSFTRVEPLLDRLRRLPTRSTQGDTVVGLYTAKKTRLLL